MQIIDLYPDRATYRPGQNAQIRVQLRNAGPTDFSGLVIARLVSLDQVIGEHQVHAHLPADTTQVLSVPLALPAEDFRGYGVDVCVQDANQRTIAEASTALDVLSSWVLAPRYGFFADFAPGELDSAERAAELSKYHINVVQFYDWMYRHYQLLPPPGQEVFVDALGRRLSMDTVRAKIEAAHEHNMAALAYGAIYGAEPEYFAQHPEQALYKSSGEPESIERLFYIMDIRRGSPWHRRILEEFRLVVTELPFDGIHLDQYGFPKVAHVGGPHGPQVFLDDLFPPFIEDAAAVVAAARPGAKVIFNNVNDWPTEKTATTNQAAVYIEVWPPHDTYSDLRHLILKAKASAFSEKQVILAAYITPLCMARENPDILPQAEQAARLASAAVFASGGFHLLPGERNGALCDPYYPKYNTLRPEFVPIMRSLYDFAVRYENYLFDPRLVDTSDQVETYRVEGRRFGPNALKDSVWTIRRERPGLVTLSLINLIGQPHNYWDLPHPPPVALTNLAVTMTTAQPVQTMYLASPDRAGGRAERLDFIITEWNGRQAVRFTVPELEAWDLLILLLAP